jgi:hypothetical protein
VVYPAGTVNKYGGAPLYTTPIRSPVIDEAGPPDPLPKLLGVELNPEYWSADCPPLLINQVALLTPIPPLPNGPVEEATSVRSFILRDPEAVITTLDPDSTRVTINPVAPVDPIKDVQYPFVLSQVLAADPEAKGPPPDGPATELAIFIKDPSVKSKDLKNPTEARTPGISVGCVSEETEAAITYPRSSSGPFHHSSPVVANPNVGVPTARAPT